MYDKTRFAYDPKGGGIQTDVPGVALNRVHEGFYRITGVDVPAKSNTAIHLAIPLSADVAGQGITTNITNPAVPRNAIIKGNAAGLVGDVVLTGKDFIGETITETIALNGATAVEGSKAFASYTNIHVPPEVHAGTDTVSVGFGDKLGLPCKLSLNTVGECYLNGVREAAAPTVAFNTAAIGNNTVLLGSALNGTDVDIFMKVY
jgi:hypothetical protein